MKPTFVYVTYIHATPERVWHAVSHGWPALMANLKSKLETGEVLPQAPWEMHAELRG